MDSGPLCKIFFLFLLIYTTNPDLSFLYQIKLNSSRDELEIGGLKLLWEINGSDFGK